MARRAGPATPADATLGRLRRQLERESWPAGLTVLTGDDRFHLDAAQRTLLEALVPAEASDFALTVFGEDPVDIGQIVSAARSQAMFAPRRVVLVRELDAVEGEPEPLLEFARKPPPRAYLIVRAPLLDRRRKLHKALAGAGTTLSFPRPSAPGDPRTARLVAGLAAERRLRLGPGVASFLAEVCDGDLYRAGAELDKIRAWLGGEDEQQATLEIAREVGAGSEALSGWELSDALLRRDTAAALAAARDLVERGEAPLRLIGGLAWRARSMLQVRALLDGGMRGPEALRAAGAGYRGRALLDGVRHYSLDELRGFPAALLRADRTLKSRTLDPLAVLESLVEELTGGPRAQPGSRR